MVPMQVDWRGLNANQKADSDVLPESFHKMLAVGRGNEWFTFEKMACYLRVGPKMMPLSSLRLCIQIASLSTPKNLQGKGTFTRLIRHLCDLSPLPIYVEKLLNPEFREALLRRGFIPARIWDGRVWDVVLLRDGPNAS
jgi:hypothetical protein